MEAREKAKLGRRAGGAGEAKSSSPYKPPYTWAAMVGLGIFILYVITLARSTAFWDTSEYIATAHIMGIPHPPGNPVFVLLARTWEILLTPFPLPVAIKINLFSAANGAVAAAFWFLVVHRILAFFSDEELFQRVGAAATVLISSTAFTVWNQSVVNEKVYTVSLMTIALLTFLIFRWRDNLGRGKDDNLLILIVFLLALSLGNHLMAFLVAPAMFFFVLWVHPRTLARWQLYAFASLAWCLGLSAQLFLPIRAENRPVISEADPRCESLVDATIDIVRLHPPVSLLGPDKENDRCQALAESLRREQYRKPPLTLNPIYYPREVPRDLQLVRWQFINYAQYFDWQWARSLDGSNTFFAWLRAPFTLLFVLLGIYGAWRHFHEDRISWIYVAALFATVWVGLVLYLNFKYGYSVAVMIDPGTGQPVSPPREWREVRERDYFFMVSFSQWGLWAGIGLAAFWQRLSEKLAGAKAIPSSDQLRRASPILVLALLPLLLNWKYASRAGDYAARDWAYNALMSVDPYAIVFTNGDNDTFPLWYLQEVEGLRRDVTVIVYSYLATPWYTKQLRDLTKPCDGLDPLADPTVITCQRPFEPDKAIDIYSGRDWPVPTRSILQMDDAEVESVPDCYPVDNYGRCQLFADTVAVPIGNDVEGLVASGDYLSRNDIVVLRILQTSAGDRPIYFASTTGTYEKFALQPWMVREGVALKLSPDDIQPSPTIVPMPPQARLSGNRLLPFWIDIQKTAQLLDSSYVYRDLTDWTFWPDLSTNGIPLQYYQAYAALANAYIMLNQMEASNQARDRAREFVEVALGPVDFGAPAAAPPPRESAPPVEPPSDSGEPSEN
ncbi:MAG: hypothetical protein AMS21_06280 [Gemmatimonas sp. SG8_38_2]|nr:MAG: hypothetical protein AMS21_06280 [Gemmatimonas sp. SG8_38_2]